MNLAVDSPGPEKHPLPRPPPSRGRGFSLGAVALALELILGGCLGTDRARSEQIPAPGGTPTPVVGLAPTAPSVELTATPTASPTPTPHPGRTRATALRVWDGNTILIEGGLSVRYLGADTPGAGMFGRPLEPFGRQAAERNVALVEGRHVELEADASDVDPSGFLLRYVYADGVMVNEVLLREGLARLGSLGPNTRHASALQRAEAEARAVPLNIWTLVTPTPTPTVTPPPTGTPAASPTAARASPTANPRALTPSPGLRTPTPTSR